MTQPPPITPGPDPWQQPSDPTTASWQPVSPPPQQYQQGPAYYPPPQQQYVPPGSLPPGGGTEVAKKAAIGTVTVIVTLVGVFCVLPVVACLIFGLIGNGLGAITPSP